MYEGGVPRPRSSATTSTTRDVSTTACPTARATTLELRLPAKPPLLWDELLGFYAPRAIPGVEEVKDGVYRRAHVVGRSTAVVEVRADGADAVVVRARAGATAVLRDAAVRVRRMLDLDVDPRAIARRLARDARLARAVKGGVRLPGAFDPFEAGVRAVVGQQISVKAAITITGRIAARLGAPVDDASLVRAFPSAQDVVDADLAGLGLPRARAAALRAFARAVVEGDVRLDGSTDLETTLRALVAVPGIGPWTAQYVAMRGLSEKDAFPSSDLGVLKALSDDDGALITKRRAEEIAEAWRPYRAYAAVVLWRHPDGKAAKPRRRTA